MIADEFFGGSWAGKGQVRGPIGRTLRSFTVRLDGVWSEEHQAFHIDEVASYEDGRRLERQWVVQAEGAGRWLGSDSLAGRLRAEARAGGLRLRYDRPGGLGQRLGPTSATLELRQPSPDTLAAVGVTRLLGIPVARTEIAYARRR